MQRNHRIMLPKSFLSIRAHTDTCRAGKLVLVSKPLVAATNELRRLRALKRDRAHTNHNDQEKPTKVTFHR